jgi:diguanylate cyclase (GGDEF)-like protein
LLKSGRHDKKFYERMWNKIQNEGVYNGEILNKKKNGEIYPQRVSITALYDHNTITSYLTIFSDISSEKQKMRNLKEQKEQFKQQAQLDFLTQVYNRSRFEYILEYEQKKFVREKSPFCLLFMDIDHFKRINDSFGHDIGDSVLKELCLLITQHTRSCDTFARWGGEEFVLLLGKTPLHQANQIANKLLNIVQTHSFEHVEHITMSIGLCEYEKDETLGSFIKRADEALYEAKNNGRNQVKIAP